jgi:hypothetical protein
LKVSISASILALLSFQVARFPGLDEISSAGASPGAGKVQ